MTQVGQLRVGNMVDTYYSLVAGIEKMYALGDKSHGRASVEDPSRSQP